MSPSERIRRLLAQRGSAWPAPIHSLSSVGSTNAWLRECARAGAEEWTAVLADEQTAGRGRHGRPWLSQPGDLALSVLVRPGGASDALTLLPLAAGVAVVEAAAELGAAASLKWPNDVVCERGRGQGVAYRKLAGILVEGLAEGDALAAVIGVGLNLESPEAGELVESATSLREVTGRQPDREEAAAAVLARLAVWYDHVARGRAQAVVEAWSARALPWWGRPVEVQSGDTVLRGRARGIDGRGALLLELEDGAVVAVLSGEARQVRPGG